MKYTEIEFLKYLIDCCENILEHEEYGAPPFDPATMQLQKMRAEVTARLNTVYGISYGKFAAGKHLMSYKTRR